MPAHLHLHFRRVASGRVISTCVPFGRVSVDAEDVETARRRARAETSELVGDLGGSVRAALAVPRRATLATVPVALPELGVGIIAGIVVLEEPGGRLVAHAPEVPGVAVAGVERAALLETIRERLVEQLERWHVETVLAADQTDPAGEVWVEELVVPFEGEGADGGPPNPLDAQDITARAADGRLERLDQRNELVDRVLGGLASEERASVMLVGPTDAGKSTLVFELAARLAAGTVPPALTGRRLLRLSANELIAGAQYTGMWQERARQLVELGRTGAIIALGDPGGIVDAGRWNGSDNNLGRVLRPFVEEGELRLICEATPENLAAATRIDRGFVEALVRVDVPEPPPEATGRILRAAAERLGERHGVRFADEAVPAALELTRRFEPYRGLPGKAVRLLEETARDAGVPELGREQVVGAFARRSGMPLAMLADEVPLDPTAVRAFLEARVLGQDEAVDALVDLISVAKAGLADPGKPLATLLFVGPTGVGKTELTKALAEFLFGSRDRVLRFDMGEFSGGDAVARLIGSAYKRSDEQDGELTRRVREQPFCVVLLDEIEKAGREVFDVLLAGIGEGRITDAAGQTADLRNAIVVMTSNLGSAGSDRGVGFGDVSDATSGEERRRAHYLEAVERFFRPEFVNRIDQVLPFDALGVDTIRRIARREVGRLLLREGITRRRLLVEVDDAVVERLAGQGFHPKYGARPLHRAIEQAVIRPLAQLIVAERPRARGARPAHRRPDGIAVEVHRIVEPPARSRPVRADQAAAAGPGPTLAKLAARAGVVRDELEASAGSPLRLGVGERLSGLVEAVGAPGFWDAPDQARATLAELYALQRVVDADDALRRRADGPARLAEELRARRDRSRLAEVRDALGELDEQAAVLRVELAGALAGPEDDLAVLTCTPVAPDGAAWADELLEMYVRWADRTGREARREDGERTVVITGPAAWALLRGEVGLHRLHADGGRRLARVRVAAPGKVPIGDRDPGELVRVYRRDARTEVP